MKRIVSFPFLVWLVCISVVTSEQPDHHHDEDATAMKDADSKLKETYGSDEGEGKKIGKLAGFNNVRGVPSSNLREQSMDSDSDFSVDSGSFEDGGMKDRGLFDIFDGPSRPRRRRGMFSPTPFGRGRGGGYGRGRRGRSPYNQFADPRYSGGMGYSNGSPYGSGRRHPQGEQYQFGQYPSRLGQYQGGRGGRMGSQRFGGGYPGAGYPGAGYPGAGYPGASGYFDEQPYRQPHYRDVPTESNTPVEPVVAR